jgi:outer membrane receptor protein involved in Fe transport
LRLGASYSHARIEASGAAARLQGLRPAQTPELTATGEIGWHDGNRAASIIVRHAGSQSEDDLNQRLIRPSTTVDAFLAWPLTERVQIVARGQNLFNETVIATLGSDGTVERATPRTLWIGLRFVSLP